MKFENFDMSKENEFISKIEDHRTLSQLEHPAGTMCGVKVYGNNSELDVDKVYKILRKRDFDVYVKGNAIDGWEMDITWTTGTGYAHVLLGEEQKEELKAEIQAKYNK